MANYPYDEVGTKLDRTFAATLNKNFDEIEDDIRQLVETVGPILDDSFDSAALAAEFEERLNNEIQKLQPDWVEFKQNTTAQLAQKVGMDYLEATLSLYSGGGVKDVFYSLNALNTMHPDGAMGPMLVYDAKHADGAHQYTWVSGAWKDLGLYNPEGIADKTVTEEKTSFMSIGKNKFDKSTRSLGKNLTYTTGGLASNPEYDTSDFIPVYAGVSYEITKNRQWVLFNQNKVYITGYNNATYAPSTVTPTENGFLKFSVKLADVNTSMVRLSGTDETFERFGYQIDSQLFSEDQKKSIEKVVQKMTKPTFQKNVRVEKSGDLFTLKSSFDNMKDIIITTERYGSNNKSFNFVNTQIGGDSIHSTNDDITPIRTFNTVGANHGYECVVKVTMSNHQKTSSDLGSQWTDGLTMYTLLEVVGDVLTFGCPYSEIDGVVKASTVNPISNLTHVSGASNTTEVNVSDIAYSPQLYPSVNNISVKYLLDGNEITEDGNYEGDELVVEEQYTIMDYKSIIDYAQANLGKSYKTAKIAGIVEISNTFVFRKGLKCTTSHSLSILKKTTFGRCGFLQSVALNLLGHSRKRFMPNVKVKSGFDFANGVDLDTFSTTIYYSPSDFVDPLIPPSRYTDWLYHSDGLKKYGFTMGYIVDKTNSKNSDRLTNAPYAWDMRNTKKSYPIAIENITLEAGDYMNFMGFRHYISPEEVGEANSVAIVEDSKDVYVYADFNKEVMNKKINIRGFGKTVTVLQSENLTVKNETIDASGLTITSASGNAVIKVE